MASSAEIVTEAERLHRGNQWREAFEYLKAYSDEATEPEILWRQLRAYYRVGKHLAKDKQETEYIMQKGLEIMERATKTHEDHFQVQKWAGVFLSWQSEMVGTKCKIERAFDVKKHFEKAIAIDGSDPEVKHTLGRWCYEVASVSWVMRKLAQAIFAAPPESSYDEALKYFLDAEETKPGFYTGNWLYLARTYYQLGKYDEAKGWLKKLLEHSPDNVEDEEYQAEGMKLQKKL